MLKWILMDNLNLSFKVEFSKTAGASCSPPRIVT